jgi:hypothetical protein
MAITMSIPLFVLVWVLTSCVWGRASAVIISAMPNKRNANNMGRHLAKLPDLEKASTLELSKCATCLFREKICHANSMGINNRPQKKSG